MTYGNRRVVRGHAGPGCVGRGSVAPDDWVYVQRAGGYGVDELVCLLKPLINDPTRRLSPAATRRHRRRSLFLQYKKKRVSLIFSVYIIDLFDCYKPYAPPLFYLPMSHLAHNKDG